MIGYVVDKLYLQLLAGVKVSISQLNLLTTTNKRGFYFLNVPEYPNRIDFCEKMIKTAITFVYEKKGFKTLEISENYLIR